MGMKKEGKFHYAWWILIGCCMVQLMTMGIIVNAGSMYFLEIVKDFNSKGQTIALSELSMFFTALSLAFVVGMSIVNPLLKRFNLRVLMTVGLLLMVVAQGAMAFYHHAPLWGVSGFLFGVVAPAVGVVPPAMMLMNWFHKKQGTVLAIQSAFGGIGGAIMNPLTELLIQQFGWRATYLITAGLIALAVLPFTLFVFRMTPGEKGMRALGSREQVPVNGASLIEVEELPGISVQEAKKLPAFWLIMLAMAFLGFTMSFMQFLKAYAATVDWEAMGATMTSLAMVGSLAGNLLMGALTDRFGLKKIYRLGAAVVSSGLLLLLVGRSNLYLLFLGCLLYGMIQGLSMVGTPLLVRQSFGSKDYANIYSQLSRIQGLLGAVAFYVVSKLAELLGTPTRPNYAPTMAVGMICILLLTVIIPLALQQAPMQQPASRETVKEL